MRVATDRLTEAIISVLTTLGADDSEARLVAESRIAVDLRGNHSHGSTYLFTIAERIAAGHINIPTQVEPIADDGAVVHLKGNNGLGQVAAAQQHCL